MPVLYVFLMQVPSVHEKMVKARITLQNLKTLTYNFPITNTALASEFTQKLDDLYHLFYSRLPNEEGLIYLTQNQESFRSTKKRDNKVIKDATDYRALPPPKKFKKSLDSRVGRKAEIQRKEAKAMVQTLILLCILLFYLLQLCKKKSETGTHANTGKPHTVIINMHVLLIV